MLSKVFVSFGLVLTLFSSPVFSSEPLCGQETICSPNDCYTIIERLGAGAFGEVFAVENSKGEKFALKSVEEFYSCSYDDFWGLLENVEREYSRGQELDHPNIIKSYDVFSDEMGTGYIVLDLVEGKTLYSLEKGALSGEEAIKAILQFVEALEYAYAMGYTHFDLHVGNIMVSNTSEIKIIDLASFLSGEELKTLFFFYEESKTLEENADLLSLEEANTPMARKLAHIKRFAEEKKKVEQRMEAQGKRVARGLTEDDFGARFFLSWYFDRVTEACLKILWKADLEREQIINLSAEIKKLSWNCGCDLEEGIDFSLTDYFSQLTELIAEQSLAEEAA